MAHWRLVLTAATVWVVAFIGVYLAVVVHEDNGVAWWYVGVLVVTAVLLALAATERVTRPWLMTAAILLGVSTALGLLSVGALLLPPLVAVAYVLATTAPQPVQSSQPGPSLP